MRTENPAKKIAWSQLIPDNEWAAYELAIRVVRKAKVDFLIAGAFGLAVYTGRWRNTKDLDLLVLPGNHECRDNRVERCGIRRLLRTMRLRSRLDLSRYP